MILAVNLSTSYAKEEGSYQIIIRLAIVAPLQILTLSKEGQQVSHIKSQAYEPNDRPLSDLQSAS